LNRSIARERALILARRTDLKTRTTSAFGFTKPNLFACPNAVFARNSKHSKQNKTQYENELDPY
jgi:hypothetical protein